MKNLNTLPDNAFRIDHAYVICEIGWEYNDEDYYRTETEGGKPRAVYTSKSIAEQECKRMNKEAQEKNVSSGHPMHSSHWNEDANDYDPITEFYEVVEVKPEQKG